MTQVTQIIMFFIDTSKKKFSKRESYTWADAQYFSLSTFKFGTFFVGNFLSYIQKTDYFPSF